MIKNIKIFSVVLIVFSIVFSFYGVFASDINMNLVDNSIVSNTLDTNIQDENTTLPDIQTPSDDLSGELSASGVNAVQEEGLSLSNILSILVITVGVILILLAIAIIIRLK